MPLSVDARNSTFNNLYGDQHNHTTIQLTLGSRLAPAVSTYKLIVSAIRNAQTSGQQLSVLADCAFQLLQTLNAEYRAGRLVESSTSASLADLDSLLQQILIFVQTHANCDFVKSLDTKDQVKQQIEAYHLRIGALVNAFHISTMVNIHDWQSRYESARARDQATLHCRFNDLEANNSDLARILNQTHNSVMAMSIFLQRLLNKTCEMEERQFLSHSIQFLATSSGRQVELKSWMTTSFEVEFGSEIGRGGFGRVFEGQWNGRDVALKVLRTDGGDIPRPEAIRCEIDTWSKLSHPHILKFLGANVFDERPFIVMPLLKNGNARHYVREHPYCDILKFLHQVSLGLKYLHSQRVVHGDLKALNILIDDDEKAVLCDFGLSRVRADMTSHMDAVVNPTDVAGSRNWLAPERLVGQTLRYPCDIYSFGMTLYEMYTNNVPLGDISNVDFRELVVNRNVRPERPQPNEAPQLTDDIWKLAEDCWLKDPHQRPSASTICTILSCRLLPGTAGPSRLPFHSPNLSPPSTYTTAPQSQYVSGPPPGVDARSGERLNVHRFKPGFQRAHIRRLTLQWSMSALTAVRSVVFSPDGNQLASSHRNGKIVVWNAETGKVACAQFKGHQNSVHSIAFSPDGTRIVSGSRDKTVMVWDAVTGSSVLAPLTGHNDCITSVALSPDGKQIISGSKDGVVRFWSAVTGNVILVSHSRTRSAVTSVAFFPDGSWAVAGSSELDFWMWDTKKETWKWNDYPAEAFQEAKAIRSVAITASGKVIVCGSGTNIQVWNSDTGELLESPYPTNDGLINSVAISPDAKLIVSGSHNSSFRVWDVDTGNPVAGKVYVPNRLGTPKDATRKEVYSVALSPKKGCIALGTASDIEVYAYI